MKHGAIGLALLVALAALHEVLARSLDDAGLIERLLSPGPDALIAMPAAIVLYGLRLGLMFAGPGVVLMCAIAITHAGRARWAQREGRERR